MTKQDLVNEIAISTGYDKGTILNIVESFMAQVKHSLEKDENVYLRGFGTFENRLRKEKMARDIKNNVAIVSPAHKLPYFKASPDFREQVNK